MTPALSPHYHVGIVVRDLAAARVELAALLGVAWGPVVRLEAAELRDGAGRDITVPLAICYSVDAPHLELIEEVPGSVWECNDGSNLHHIGFWSDDLDEASRHLGGRGCPLQLSGRSGEAAPSQFAYHGTGLGVRVEVVDAALRPFMESHLFTPSGP